MNGMSRRGFLKTSAGLLLTVATLNAPLLAGNASAAPVFADRAVGAGRGVGMLVFQMSSGGAIFAVKPDGKQLRRLTTGMDPALSPDGKQVAFTRWDGQQNGITGSLWVINVDGTGERQVAAGANQPKSPTWSADGSQIVISMQQDGKLNDSYLCLVDGKVVELPTEPDGARCRLSPANPYWGLRIVDVATGAFEDLPRDTHSFAPTWDPANAWRVVFRGDKGLEALDLNEKTTWTVKAGGAYRGPVFSPDGSQLAVTFKQNDHWEVHTLNADGTGEARLTDTPAAVFTKALLAGRTAHAWNNAAPAWSPDGKQIAFISDRNGPYELWVMNADGSRPRVLLDAATLGAAGIAYEGVDERVIAWK